MSVKREDEQTVDDYWLFRHTLFHNDYHFQKTDGSTPLLQFPLVRTSISNLQEQIGEDGTYQ